MNENCQFDDKILYLDHAGATLPDKQQLNEYYEFLISTTFANPHSRGYLGEQLNYIIEDSRKLVLNHFGADSNEYSVVFTSGATAGIKLIGECFPWTSSSIFAYPYNSHTSILGLREYSPLVYCIPSDSIQNLPSDSCLKSSRGGEHSLLAIPGECNFSGTKYPPEIISRLLDHISEDYLLKMRSSSLRTSSTNGATTSWLWLLDASKLASTHRINISLDYSLHYRPDFVVCSFYKIFGFPTGIGALLVKKSIAPLLRKRYFGGGSVNSVVADRDWMIPASSIHTMFEDGTLNYHGIAALKYGFGALSRVGGMSWIQQHTFDLCQYLFDEMCKLRHSETDLAMCTIYGNHGLRDSRLQGSILSFNLKWSNGSWVGFNEVEKAAIENNIQLRTGCFCCIGGCQEALSLTGEQIQQNVTRGRNCQSTSADLIDDYPTGAVRISVGYMTTYNDCNQFIQFLTDNFLDKSPQTLKKNEDNSADIDAFVTTMYIYPIKSCAGISVYRWPLSSYGFFLDRRYALRSSISGRTLTLKSYPKLALCIPYITMDSDWLMLTAPEMKTILGIHIVYNQGVTVPIELINESGELPSDQSVLYSKFLKFLEQASDPINKFATISGSVENCFDCQNAIQISSIADRWFSDYLQFPCTLMRHDPSENNQQNLEKSFSNSGQFLMISKQSIENLEDKLVFPTPYQISSGDEEKGQVGTKVTEKKFRPNIIINCPNGQPHEEDSWTHLTIDIQHDLPNVSPEALGVTFLLTGPCTRCTVINVNPENGEKESQTLKILSSYRKDEKCNILFGQYLAYEMKIQELLNHVHFQGSESTEKFVMEVNSFCRIQRRVDGEGRE